MNLLLLFFPLLKQKKFTLKTISSDFLSILKINKVEVNDIQNQSSILFYLNCGRDFDLKEANKNDLIY